MTDAAGAGARALRWAAAGPARRTLNRRISQFKRVFRWGAENELIPPEAWHRLQVVEGLRRGQGGRRFPRPRGPLEEERRRVGVCRKPLQGPHDRPLTQIASPRSGDGIARGANRSRGAPGAGRRPGLPRATAANRIPPAPQPPFPEESPRAAARTSPPRRPGRPVTGNPGPDTWKPDRMMPERVGRVSSPGLATAESCGGPRRG